MKDFKYNFEVDYQNKNLKFADKEFKFFRTIKKSSDVLSLFGISLYGREGNKYFTTVYGITPSNFKKVFNAKILNIWVDPIKEHVSRFAYRRSNCLNTDMLSKIWNNIDKIKQAEKDGIYHIVPWIIAFEKSPDELKNKIGKSFWKKICKQSMTRNKYLASGHHRFTRNYYGECLNVALNLPSYLLKKGGNQKFPWCEATEYLIKNKIINSSNFKKSGRIEDERSLSRLYNIFKDTLKMAKELNKKFDKNWSIEKLKKKHEEYLELINLKKYSSEMYEVLKDFKHREFAHNDFRISLLDNAKDIVDEGTTMHHCVGSYISRVADGEYLVYSVKKHNERSSTIAFHRHQLTDKWNFNQHYGMCNKFVVDTEEKEIKDLILKEINNEKS